MELCPHSERARFSKLPQFCRAMKTAVVTGATRGIGRAVAFKLAREGFAVAVCSSQEEKVRVFANDFKEAFPEGEFIAQVCDVRDKGQLSKFCDAVKAKWDQVDLLVNNAGIFVPGTIADSDDGELEKIIETNLYSAHYTTRNLLPLIRRSKKALVVNLCSTASLNAYPNGALYGISKFALNGFSKSLREELKPLGIAVTSFLPGAVFTDSWAESGIDEERFMKVEDIADLVWSIYSLSDRTVVEEVVLRPMQGDI